MVRRPAGLRRSRPHRRDLARGRGLLIQGGTVWRGVWTAS
jgi:hypothetical protein